MSFFCCSQSSDSNSYTGSVNGDFCLTYVPARSGSGTCVWSADIGSVAWITEWTGANCTGTPSTVYINTIDLIITDQGGGSYLYDITQFGTGARVHKSYSYYQSVTGACTNGTYSNYNTSSNCIITDGYNGYAILEFGSLSCP